MALAGPLVKHRFIVHIIYLYSEVMPYTIAVMRALVRHHQATIHCVYFDQHKKTPFIPQDEPGIHFWPRSQFHLESLRHHIQEFAPQIMYLSGRMDPDYLQLALEFRRQGVITVAGSDNQWHGSLKQQVARCFSHRLYRRYFEFIWVPGDRQYQFARRIGFRDDHILRNLYSADTEIFNRAYAAHREGRQRSYPHTVAFVGRFTRVKGINFLCEAFGQLRQEIHHDWRLVLVGNGDFPIPPEPWIEVNEFMSPAELASRSADWGVFCLPSIWEAWGVVVHEFAAAGLPLICSNCVGAADAFLRDGQNGALFRAGDALSLKNALRKLITATDEQLVGMGDASHAAAALVSPDIAAESLLNCLRIGQR